ncbi:MULTISPECIES: hypothetical protein [Leptolyngbya]|uniref:hypothetical protein n=1 Tax=Leptolyngbya TaxID=47251 RepID=UPI001687B613|nr:hypothetical protein [Leptolyngbya sp. FACHB-1624]MBD1858666.1 hypothetical protein [Leptolyngbya sp. FACHB-1624]
MSASDVGRPKRSRKTDRVNYNLDSALRAILQDIAERNGRNEGSQVEQLILFYEAAEQLNSEGTPLTFDAINARIRRIWTALTKDEKTSDLA